jgi:hypothetical protein
MTGWKLPLLIVASLLLGPIETVVVSAKSIKNADGVLFCFIAFPVIFIAICIGAFLIRQTSGFWVLAGLPLLVFSSFLLMGYGIRFM